MKKLFLSLCCALSLTASAQSLKCVFADGSSMTVAASLNEDGQLKTIVIPLSEFKNSNNKCNMYFRTKYTKDLSEVAQCFREAAAKWREWDKTAEENNVTDLSKDLPVQTPRAYSVWTRVQTWVSKAKPRSFLYTRKAGKSTVTLYAYFNALTNHLISISGVKTFTTPDDLDKLADTVAPMNLILCLQQKQSTSDLFQ